MERGRQGRRAERERNREGERKRERKRERVKERGICTHTHATARIRTATHITRSQSD
jgi:hypothetical protein